MEFSQVSVLIPCRDGEKTLESTIRSLLNQELDVSIVIADDASKDKTPDVIHFFKKYGKVKSVRYPRREPRNYARVPVLINMASKVSLPSDFYMISGDDSVYPPDYLKKLINFMRNDEVELASGYFDKYEHRTLPSGSGRLITAALFKKITPFPNGMGWESWMIYKALLMGKRVAVYPIRYKHERKYSYKSTLTFGYSAYVNGVPFIFTLLRALRSLVLGIHTPINSIFIVIGHLEYIVRNIEKFDTAPFVYNLHKWRIKKFIRRLIDA